MAQHLSLLNGVDTFSNAIGSFAIQTDIPLGAQIEDAIVLASSGPTPVGARVGGLFSGPVIVPSARNITVSPLASGIGGTFLLQVNDVQLQGTTILVIYSTP
jgi:hypothetical protein